MARADSLQPEISVRLAIGSGRSHLLQQFLAESLLIAFLGSLAGLIAANWALRGLISTIPWDIPLTTQVRLDIWVLGFTSLLTIGTSLIFGLTSYLQATRLDLNTSLRGQPWWGRITAHNHARSTGK